MIKDIKPKLHETDIRMLIDRYMSGDTTNEEEDYVATRGFGLPETTYLKSGDRCEPCSVLWTRSGRRRTAAIHC